MTADEFARRLCAALLTRRALIEDGEAHRLVYGLARELFAEAAGRAGWEKAGVAGTPTLPNRV